MKITVVTVRSESGDEYGPFAFKVAPTVDELEEFLREWCPGEFHYRGCGWRGSQLYVDQVRVLLR